MSDVSADGSTAAASNSSVDSSAAADSSATIAGDLSADSSAGVASGPRETRSVTLRPMTAADVNAVHALETRMFPLDAWPRYMFDDEIAQPETRHYLVGEDPETGRIVAYAGLMCVPPIADVQTIAVVPEFEGRGMGAAMLQALIDEAKQRQADDVLLEVRADNDRAQRLYERFGFQRIHRRAKYYRDGADALIMRLQGVREQ